MLALAGYIAGDWNDCLEMICAVVRELGGKILFLVGRDWSLLVDSLERYWMCLLMRALWMLALAVSIAVDRLWAVVCALV